MKQGVELWVVWNDNDMIELEIVGCNGKFGGTALTYDNPDAPKVAADALKGFPTSNSDAREIGFGGSLGLAFKSGIRLRFSCKDSAGHLTVEVNIQSDNRDEERESVRFAMPVEPGAIDIFVQQLYGLQDELYGKTAMLAIAK